MRLSLAKPLIASLIAIAASGCASQNAMTLVPADVRLEMAAESARKAKPPADDAKAEEQGPQTKGESSARPEKGPGLAELRKLADGARGGEPPPADPAPALAAYAEDRIGSETDPRLLLEQALEAQDGGGEKAEDAAAAGPAPGEDAWRRMLAMAPGAAAPTDATTTAALAPPAAPGQTATVSFSGDGVALSRDSDVQLRLMKSGGLTPARIVVGRIAGAASYEALDKASARGRQIAAVVGGDPGIAYDPSLPAGSAVVNFVPSARRS